MNKKDKLIFWLKENPGVYRTRTLAREHGVSRSVVLAALSELECNNMAEKRLGGRNTRWIVK